LTQAPRIFPQSFSQSHLHGGSFGEPRVFYLDYLELKP
jgi:hypothetical protein